MKDKGKTSGKGVFKYRDLSGEKIGYWEVLYRDEKKERTSFVCRCVCGKTRSVDSYSLRKSISKSCGCKQNGENNRIEAFKEALDITDKSIGCWVWPKGMKDNGYGSFRDESGKDVGAHRYSYQYFKGEITEGMHVCHTCDNRACFNPDHLYASTQKTNNWDYRIKARNEKRRMYKSSKLSESEVIEIYQSEISQTELSKSYGVSIESINGIKNKRTWRHITEGLVRGGRVNEPWRERLYEKEWMKKDLSDLDQIYSLKQ